MSVRITTLGQVRVSVADRERPSLPQQRLRCALLIYVAVECDCARESLLGVFWPDRPQSRARHILSQGLYELRYAIGDDVLRTDGDRVVIGPDVKIDLREFEHNVEHGAIDAALAAYRGPFLDGFTLPNNNAFDTWTERKRAGIERLHRRARREQIHALEAAGDTAGALAAAHAWADVHPLEDEAQHKLLERLLAAGHRTEAKTRFDKYRRLLREELDVSPLDETIALFETDSPPATARLSHSPVTSPASEGAASAPPTGAQVPAADDDGSADRPTVDAVPADRPAAADEGGRRNDSASDAASGRGEAGKGAAPDPSRPATVGPAVDPAASAEGRTSPLRSRWQRALIAALGIAAVGIAAARLIDGSPSPQSLALPIDSAGYDPSRIAVLYFEDISEAHDVGHIASGLTEALITELDRVEALSVVSRDGVKPFVDSVVPPQQIAAALRAGSIVAGSIQRSGDQLRLTVQLVEGATGNLLESAAFQRTMGELFELQDDLARRVARILRDRIGREVTIRRLTGAAQPEAWELVRRAIEVSEDLWLGESPLPPERRRGAKLELDAAGEYLRQAEQIDPTWPEPTRLRGWVALGRAKAVGGWDTAAYNREIRGGLAIVDELLERGFAGAREYELRGTLRLHLARMNQLNPRYLAVRDSAEQDLRIAVSRAPTLAAASSRLSRLLQRAGDPREARYYASIALEQDAYLHGGPDIRYRLYSTSMDLGDISTARRHCLLGRVEYPGDWRFLQCQLLIPAYGGAPISPDSAQVLLRAWRQLDPPRPNGPAQYTHIFRRMLYAAILARAGQDESARDSLKRIRRDVGQNPDRLAQPFGLDEASLLLMLGDTTAALRAIGDYVARNPMYLTYLERSFQVKPLHGDPRFLAIIRDTVPP